MIFVFSMYCTAHGLPSCCTWQAFGDKQTGAVTHAMQEGILLEQRCAAGGPIQEAVQEADCCDGSHMPLQTSQHHQLHVLYKSGLKRPLPGCCHLHCSIVCKVQY